MTVKRGPSGSVSPSIVTVRSCIASSSAACVLGGVRLISSASSMSVKIGPRVSEKVEVWKLNRFAPMMRSEEHTSELQPLMRISYAVFCLKKKRQDIEQHQKLHIATHN